jgi:hypothetical protein
LRPEVLNTSSAIFFWASGIAAYSFSNDEISSSDVGFGEIVSLSGRGGMHLHPLIPLR